MVCCCKWTHVQMTMQKGWNSTKMGSWIWNCRPLCAPEVHRGQHSQQPHQPQGGCEGALGFAFRRFVPAAVCPPCGRWATSRARRTASRVLLRCSCWARGLRCCMTVSMIIIFCKMRQSFGHPSHVGDKPMSQTRISGLSGRRLTPILGYPVCCWGKNNVFFFFSKIDVWELYRLTPHFPCFGISWWRKGRSESDVTSRLRVKKKAPPKLKSQALPGQ